MSKLTELYPVGLVNFVEEFCRIVDYPSYIQRYRPGGDLHVTGANNSYRAMVDLIYQFLSTEVEMTRYDSQFADIKFIYDLPTNQQVEAIECLSTALGMSPRVGTLNLVELYWKYFK